MNVKSLVCVLPLLGLGLLGSGQQAQAVTFASFDAADFRFVNQGVNSHFGTYDALGSSMSIPLSFRYLVPNAYGAENSPIAAHLTLTSNVNGTAVPTFGFNFQNMQDITWTFTADTPINGKSTLLYGSGFLHGPGPKCTGTLFGQAKGTTANFTQDTSVEGQDVKFASDFLDFLSQPQTQEAASTSYTSLTPSLLIANNHYLGGFTGTGTGTFASVPGPKSPVPEPGSVVLLCGTGIGGVLLRLRRRRS